MKNQVCYVLCLDCVGDGLGRGKRLSSFDTVSALATVWNPRSSPNWLTKGRQNGDVRKASGESSQADLLLSLSACSGCQPDPRPGSKGEADLLFLEGRMVSVGTRRHLIVALWIVLAVLATALTWSGLSLRDVLAALLS